MYSRALKRSSAVSITVSQAFLSRSWAENGEKLDFWAAERPFSALHNLKPVLATCKLTENGIKAPCCSSSPIVVVVWRQILDHDPGAVNYVHDWEPFSAVGCKNGSETVIETVVNSPTAQNGVKASCWGQHTRISCFACPYLTTNSVPKNIAFVCRICQRRLKPRSQNLP